MKQVGQFGLWVPEDTDAPDGPTQLKQLAEGTESTDGLNDLLARAGAQSKKSIIASEQSTASGSYTLLGTPDRVQGIVLPTDGLLFIAYKALVNKGAGEGGNAAIFIGGNQLKVATTESAPKVQAVSFPNGFGGWDYIVTTPVGLQNKAFVAGDDVTTGQVLGAGTDGGILPVYMAAGTYDVEVRYRTSGTSAIAKQRKLWVWSKAF